MNCAKLPNAQKYQGNPQAGASRMLTLMTTKPHIQTAQCQLETFIRQKITSRLLENSLEIRNWR